MAQSSAAPDTATFPSVRPGRRFHIVVATVLMVGLVWTGYILKFGHCEAGSKFCVLHVATTRSDVGCEWDSWSCYVTTASDTPSTHVFLHLG